MTVEASPQTDLVERLTDDLAAFLIAGEYPTAERALDGLRELAWRRRAAAVRVRRHAGPGTRGAALGRAVVRRRPRTRAITAGAAPDLIAAGRRGA